MNGSKLKYLIDKAGMNQMDVARILGLTKTQVHTSVHNPEGKYHQAIVKLVEKELAKKGKTHGNH